LAAKSLDRLDELDTKLLELLVAGRSNHEIAKLTKSPLSTIQRRTRRLFESGLVKIKYEIDFKKFGYKIGLLHVYMSNGNSREVAEKIAQTKGILSVALHIGNSDIIAEYAVKTSGILLELMAKIKALPHVNKIVWSEEVTSIETPPKPLILDRTAKLVL
jgi:Lrp/AsnC family transcriptional regulator, regulator for asnA, asnC and gidA